MNYPAAESQGIRFNLMVDYQIMRIYRRFARNVFLNSQCNYELLVYFHMHQQ